MRIVSHDNMPAKTSLHLFQVERGSSTSQSLEELQATSAECRGSHSKSRAFSMGSESGDGLPNSDLQKQKEPARHHHVPSPSPG